MKVRTSRPALAEAARWVARAISPKPFTPIMAGMIISADAGKIILRSSDYDTSLLAEVEADVASPETILVPGFAFAAYLAAARGDTVTIERDGSLIKAAVGRSRSEFRTLDPEQYPSGLHKPSALVATIEQAQRLRDLVTPLLGHADSESPLPWGASVRLVIKDDALSVTCGTRFALGWATGEDWEAQDADADLLILASHLEAVLAGLNGQLMIKHDGGSGPVTFETADRTAQVRMIDSQYPDTDVLMDATRSGRLMIDKEDLEDATKLATTGTNRVILEFTNDQLQVISHMPEKGELASVITDELLCDANFPTRFALKTDYLLTALSAMKPGKITMGYPINGDKKCPVLITDGSARHVIAPVQIGKRS